MSNVPMNPNELRGQIQSFWSRPEGKFGVAVLLAATIGGGFLVAKSLPFILYLLSNVVSGIGLLTTIGLIGYLGFANNGIIFKILMKKILGFFMVLDPIGMMAGHIDELKKRRKKLQKGIEDLSGESRRIQNVIEAKEKIITANDNLIANAKKKLASNPGGSPTLLAQAKQEITLKERENSRLIEFLKTLHDIFNQTKKILDVFREVDNRSDFMIKDLTSLMETSEEQLRITKASSSIRKNAMDLLSGITTESDLFDASLEYVANQYGEEIGRIDDFLRHANQFLINSDINAGTFDTESLDFLASFEVKAIEYKTFDRVPSSTTIKVSEPSVSKTDTIEIGDL